MCQYFKLSILSRLSQQLDLAQMMNTWRFLHRLKPPELTQNQFLTHICGFLLPELLNPVHVISPYIAVYVSTLNIKLIRINHVRFVSWSKDHTHQHKTKQELNDIICNAMHFIVSSILLVVNILTIWVKVSLYNLKIHFRNQCFQKDDV